MHPSLNFAHRQAAIHNIAGHVDNGAFGGQREQGTGVSGGKLLFLQHAAHGGGELSQSKSVGHRRSIFPDDVGHFLVVELKFLGESLIAVGFFDRVEVGALASLEEILVGPGRMADGTTNLIGALRHAMATTGYSDLKEFQRVEVVVAPYQRS